MRSRKKIISDSSRAGQLGASIRWENHVKVPTSLIRVNKNDIDFLSLLARSRRVSVACIVGLVCDLLRSRKISLPEA